MLGTGYLLHFDVDALIKSDIAELYSSLLKGRQGGWLSPNDCRKETGFDEVADGDDIAPPVSRGQPASADEPPPQPAPSADDPAKVALLDQHRGRHA